MRSVFAVLPASILMLFAGCALMPEEPVEAPVVAAIAEVPPVSPETELPAGGAASLVLSPAVKSVSLHASSAAPARPAPSTRKQELRAAKVLESGAASAPESASRPVDIMKVVAKSEPAKGPAWMKSCQHRQQQGDVLMCDTDVLLAQPSDKVMVYVRDAKLTRKQAGGPGIVLRESLPRLYRIFVLD